MPSRLSASINGLRELQFDLAVKPWFKVHDSPPQYSRQHGKIRNTEEQALRGAQELSEMCIKLQMLLLEMQLQQIFIIIRKGYK